MTWFIYLTAMALIVTKWFDCVTTLRAVNASNETNAFAARMMRRFGVTGDMISPGDKLTLRGNPGRTARRCLG